MTTGTGPAWATVPYTGDRVEATLTAAGQIVKTWGTSQLVRKMAADIVGQFHAGSPKEEARAVQIWVHDRVKYRRDPADAELIQDPVTTVQKGGDCDDLAILAASLLRAIGHDARVATVQWKHRTHPSHAVVVDLTARSIVDPVCKEWPEQWPPAGYEVQVIRYKNDAGETVSLDGLFSKLVKALAKPFQKIFPAKTLLGKIADPLGITDPSRNLNLAGRVADVVGTAAVLVAGGWAVGAAGAAGTGAGFWATAGTGASTVGSWLGGKIAMTAAGALLASALAKQGIGQPLTPQEQAAITTYNQNPGAYGPSSGGGGGGGGAGGSYFDPTNPTGGNIAAAPSSGIPIVPIALALGAVLLFASRSKK